MVEQIPIPIPILTSSLRNTFGEQTSLASWSLLTGGARKQVFRLQLSHPDLDIVLLVWVNEKNYFGERDNLNSIRSDLRAPFLYQANSELLARTGVHVPELYQFDGSYRQVPFCFAFVEYLRAQTFNQWRQNRTAQEIPPLLGKVRDYLYTMHAIQREWYGTVLDSQPKTIACYEQTLLETYAELDRLAGAFDEINQARNCIREKLEILYGRIQPRDEYSFIHDELGPDEHLLIDEQGEIAIIDLDGCHYFDLEREHSYLKLRFGELYSHLQRGDLDPARMQFYRFCLHRSAAYGHHQLLIKGFPDAPMLKEIVEWNVQQILRFSFVQI